MGRTTGRSGSDRRVALRSEIKEEARAAGAGRGTFAEQGNPAV